MDRRKIILIVALFALTVGAVFFGRLNSIEDGEIISTESKLPITSEDGDSTTNTGETPEVTEILTQNYEEIIKPLADSGILFSTWHTINDIAVDKLLMFFIYSVEDKSIYSLQFENELRVPADELEEVVLSKFLGEVDYLRESMYYNEENNEYIFKELVKVESDYELKSTLKTVVTDLVVERMDNGEPTEILSKSYLTIRSTATGDKFNSCFTNYDFRDERKPIESAVADENTDVFVKNVSDDSLIRLLGISSAVLDDSEASFENSTISSNGLMRFFINIIMQDEGIKRATFKYEDNSYHFTVEKINEFLNSYFEDVNFNPEEVTIPEVTYSSQNQEFALSEKLRDSISYPWFQIEAVEILDSDIISIRAVKNIIPDGEQYMKEVSHDTLILKISSDVYKLISLYEEPSEAEIPAE